MTTISNTAATTNIVQLETIVQKRLNIKWVDAKHLVQDAIRNCDLESALRHNKIPMDREDEIVEEVCEIFKDLDPDEQNRMRINNNGSSSDTNANANEPEWKRKIREQAERREAEWRAQQSMQGNKEHVQTILRDHGVPEEEVQATTVKSIRKIETKPPPPESSTKDSGKAPIEHVQSYTCYCVIQ
jgi:hypothetical protein